MPIEKSDNEKIFAHTDDCYEVIAGQEEEYLEEGVETLRERELLVSEETAKNLRRAELPLQKKWITRRKSSSPAILMILHSATRRLWRCVERFQRVRHPDLYDL